MDRSTAWRAALAQLVSVAALSAALGLALPHSFFTSWGWLAGPAAWAFCALVTARVVRLPPGPVLIGAALAGLPSVLTVVFGRHWLGALCAIVLFALWCGRLARDRRLPAGAV